MLPDSALSFTGNFLNMLFKMTELQYKPNPVLERALEVLFILHADHEQNCSTHAMRGIGSSQVDPYSALAGAAAALYGPLHGGANEAVLRMLKEIGSLQNIPEFIKRVKGGEGRLMGFGHRVYKSYDPRAKIIKRVADEVFEVTGKNPLLDIALELERIALEDDYFVKRKLYPNVDFYSGLIYQAMGFPVDMFPVLFAIPRTAGWLAQWEEMLTRSRAEDRPPASALRRLGAPRLRSDGSARVGHRPQDAASRTAQDAHPDRRRRSRLPPWWRRRARRSPPRPPPASAAHARWRTSASSWPSARASPALPGAAKARDYITAQLKAAGLAVQEQAFDATTPRGLGAHDQPAGRHPGHPSGRGARRRSRFSASSSAGHYDTKLFKEFTFVGANDGGSSAALLIELARVLKPRTLPMDVELLFLDGEEAVGEWQGSDHTYGSRYYVQAAKKAGTLKTIGALSWST